MVSSGKRVLEKGENPPVSPFFKGGFKKALWLAACGFVAFEIKKPGRPF